MRLIDGDKLEEVLAKHQTRYYVYSDYYEGISQGFNLARYDVKEAPTIEAEPVRHGMWKKVTAYEGGDFHFYECSMCGEPWWFKMNYCAKCGARMDKAEE